MAQSEVLAKGLAWDRRWMLIDEHGNFLTQRNQARLALFKCEPTHLPSGFTISFGSNSCTVPVEAEGAYLQAVVWNDKVEVQEVSTNCTAFFSELLNMKCRLVFFPEHAARPVDPQYAPYTNCHTSLSDGYPILLLGEESLKALNQKLAQPVPINRFRPNIVFSGGAPFIEDEFGGFTIGNVKLRAVKPCARCIVTTINQETGTKGIEPLSTLATFRKINNKVMFGMNVVPEAAGQIAVGDAIYLS